MAQPCSFYSNRKPVMLATQLVLYQFRSKSNDSCNSILFAILTVPRGEDAKELQMVYQIYHDLSEPRIESDTLVVVGTSEETDLNKRPLLCEASDPQETLSQIYRERHPLYRLAAGFVVETDKLTPNQVTEQILELCLPSK